MIWAVSILGALFLWGVIDMFICYQRAAWQWPQKAEDHTADIYLFLLCLAVVLVCVGYVGYYIGAYGR